MSVAAQPEKTKNRAICAHNRQTRARISRAHTNGFGGNMPSEIREPKQERSIEKKRKIIRAGYDLFATVGYYDTNTAEIAKRAGVSTGIVYGYFKDKRDILLDVLEIYVATTYEPFLSAFDGIALPIDYKKMFNGFIDNAILTHRQNAKIHEVLHSMRHVDEQIDDKFLALEDEMTLRFAKKIEELGISVTNPLEKIHVSINLIQSFSHESVYDKHSYLNYAEMKSEVVKILVGMFKQ